MAASGAQGSVSLRGRQHIVVTGYAKMPEGTAVRSLYEQLTIGVVVNCETHIVLRATSTLVTDVGREWLKEVLEGMNIVEDQEQFAIEVRGHYWGQAQAAIVQCFRDLVRRYQDGLSKMAAPPR